MINLNFLSKLQITVFNKSFIIHIVSFYRYKLMSHYLDFYNKYAVKPLGKNCNEDNQQRVLKIDMHKKYTFTLGNIHFCQKFSKYVKLQLFCFR